MTTFKAFPIPTKMIDIDALVARVDKLDASVVLRGAWDPASGAFPGAGAAQPGDAWIVSALGVLDGVTIPEGAKIVALTANADPATFAGNWWLIPYVDKLATVKGQGSQSVDGTTDRITIPGAWPNVDDISLVVGGTAQVDGEYRVEVAPTLMTTDIIWTPGGVETNFPPSIVGWKSKRDQRTEKWATGFTSLDELKTAIDQDGFDVSEGSVIFVDGFGLQKTAGFALPGLNNWRPHGDVLDLHNCGSDGELANDFVGLFEQACEDAAAKKWKFHVSPMRDGTPFEFAYIDHTLTGDLRVEFDPAAVFYPTANFQYYETNVTIGPFVITDFAYDPAYDYALSAMLVTADMHESKLVQDTDFTVSLSGGQYSVTLAVAPPAGSYLQLCRRNAALRFRSTLGEGRRVNLMGIPMFNSDRLGYVLASASGTAISFTNVDWISVEKVWADSGAESGWGATDFRNKHGDSAISALGFYGCHVGEVWARGMNDLACYFSGGGDPDSHADDARGLRVGHVYAERCPAALKFVRQGEMADIMSIHAVDCGTGYLHGELGIDTVIPPGRGINIHAVNMIRCGRRALDIRDATLGSVWVNRVSVRDIGYMPDGVALGPDPAGVFLAGSAGVQVESLEIEQRDWPVLAGAPAVWMAGSGNHANDIKSGVIQGLDLGVMETGSTVNDRGNRISLTLKNVATQMSLAPGSDTRIALKIITETDGVITTADHNERGPLRQTFAPAFFFPAPVGTPVFSYSRQFGRYDQDGIRAQFDIDVQASFTHAETDKELRIQLPSILTSGLTWATPVILGRETNLVMPNFRSGPYAEVPADDDYARLSYIDTSGNNVAITSDHVVSGTTVRMSISGNVPLGG